MYYFNRTGVMDSCHVATMILTLSCRWASAHHLMAHSLTDVSRTADKI